MTQGRNYGACAGFAQEKSRRQLLAQRLSGELLGLTCAGCDLRKEGVTVNLSGKIRTIAD